MLAFLTNLIYNKNMKDLRKNQTTKIFFDANDNEIVLDCTIKEMFPDRLVLNFPIEAEAMTQYLQEGEPIDVKIFTPLGVKVFESMVIEAPANEEIIIEFVENAVHIQRREYARSLLRTKLTLEISRELYIASTIDISGGGIKFECKDELAPDQVIKGRLYLKNVDKPVVFDGVILDNPSLSPDEYALAFTNIDEKERDKVIKACFEIELSLNKK